MSESESIGRDMFIPLIDTSDIEFAHIEKTELPEEDIEIVQQYKPVLDTIPEMPEIEETTDGYIPIKMMLPFSMKNKEWATELLDKILAGKIHVVFYEEEDCK